MYYILQMLKPKPQIKNIISLLELRNILKDLKSIIIGFGIRVIDVTIEQVTVYNSMQAVTKAVGINNKGIKNLTPEIV